ncbi:hypothetical protein K469DRAFT_300125 [Zopfia rhizophila CBS 207.26]|uniref:Uncharacterized protein n=1 Tax=Zopfia rhizophila CBS 207.26 TaxID=1314779 RepID=A0A6A6DMX6_9PEZI|nr:hypothetical protein K469DRAFT_300125 [Zopfia rhizophila CBS 207.26]
MLPKHAHAAMDMPDPTSRPISRQHSLLASFRSHQRCGKPRRLQAPCRPLHTPHLISQTPTYNPQYHTSPIFQAQSHKPHLAAHGIQITPSSAAADTRPHATHSSVDTVLLLTHYPSGLDTAAPVHPNPSKNSVSVLHYSLHADLAAGSLQFSLAGKLLLLVGWWRRNIPHLHRGRTHRFPSHRHRRLFFQGTNRRRWRWRKTLWWGMNRLRLLQRRCERSWSLLIWRRSHLRVWWAELQLVRSWWGIGLDRFSMAAAQEDY